jgi:hypothetical protein
VSLREAAEECLTQFEGLSLSEFVSLIIIIIIIIIIALSAPLSQMMSTSI